MGIKNSSGTMDSFKTSYGGARVLAALTSVLGWLVIVAGVIVVLWGVDTKPRGLNPLLAMLPGAGTVLTGIFILMASHVVRATADTADNSKALLAFMLESDR